MTSYKLATFASNDGPRAGLVIGDKLVDIGKATGKAEHQAMLGVLSDWEAVGAPLRTIAHQAGATGMPLGEARLLAPIPVPGTIFCAGANYADHAAEMAR